MCMYNYALVIFDGHSPEFTLILLAEQLRVCRITLRQAASRARIAKAAAGLSKKPDGSGRTEDSEEGPSDELDENGLDYLDILMRDAGSNI